MNIESQARIIVVNSGGISSQTLASDTQFKQPIPQQP